MHQHYIHGLIPGVWEYELATGCWGTFDFILSGFLTISVLNYVDRVTFLHVRIITGLGFFHLIVIALTSVQVFAT